MPTLCFIVMFQMIRFWLISTSSNVEKLWILLVCQVQLNNCIWSPKSELWEGLAFSRFNYSWSIKTDPYDCDLTQKAALGRVPGSFILFTELNVATVWRNVLTCWRWGDDCFSVESQNSELRQRHTRFDGHALVSCVPRQSNVVHAVANWGNTATTVSNFNKLWFNKYGVTIVLENDLCAFISRIWFIQSVFWQLHFCFYWQIVNFHNYIPILWWNKDH